MNEPNVGELRNLFNLSVEMMCVADDSNIQVANPAFIAGFGYTAAELSQKPFLELIHPDDRERAVQEVGRLYRGETTLFFELRGLTAGGEVRWFQWSARADASSGLIYACGRDITNQHSANEKLQKYTDMLERAQLELKEALEELARMASTDALTGLLNRRGFETRASEELSRSERYGRPLGVALFDIDHFKVVNDEYGHPMGDVVLREVARRMEAACRHHDVVARWGGEEFAVLFPETPLDDARAAAERIALSVGARPMLLSSDAISVRISGGVASAVGSTLGSIFDLIGAADASLLLAKRNGRDRIEAGELTDLKLAG